MEADNPQWRPLRGAKKEEAMFSFSLFPTLFFKIVSLAYTPFSFCEISSYNKTQF